MTEKRRNYRKNGANGANRAYGAYRVACLVACLLIPLCGVAQITIGGNVFGGARQAGVNGSSSVKIHGGPDLDDSKMITIKGVFGGNDIAGTVSGGSTVTTDGGKHLFVGQLFGGGNGDYDYEHEKILDSEGEPTSQDNPYYNKQKPEIGNASVNIKSGTFGYVYAGGNAATVTSTAQISINNTSVPLDINGADDSDAGDDLLSDATLQYMGINTEYFNQAGVYNFSRVFGGNNKAEMHIRPTWNLMAGKIENLYSGGNEGPMTCPEGLLLEIGDNSNITVTNVFGGCRKADVRPENSPGVVASSVPRLDGYQFPANFAARVRVRSGNITNIYGGNDVSGRVYFGNAIGLFTSITGNIYGGGNGSYPYTDNDKLKTEPRYSDFFYDKTTVLSNAGISEIAEKMKSVTALNLVRPVSEQVSIRVDGSEDSPTIIGGSIYLGGNSATLLNPSQTKVGADGIVELKLGDYVIAENVFLGNNGEDMVKNESDDDVLRIFKSTNKTDDDTKFNSMDLTDADVFAEYMKAVAMDHMPKLSVDDYDDAISNAVYSTMIGSLFLGGNRGSMTYSGTNTMNFHEPIIIYNKIVGGCNNANIDEQWSSEEHTDANKLNASYKGGIKTALTAEEEALNPNKLVLNFNPDENDFGGIRIKPMRWKNEADKSQGLVWNTVSASTGNNVPNVTETGAATRDDTDRRLLGGNIYGGCYTSGYVNGNVEININEPLVNRNEVFDVVTTTKPSGAAWPAGYEPKLYEEKAYTITTRNSGVILDEQGMDVLGSALNVFGGGYGVGSEIWGNATINLNRGYVFQVFGGGEAGIIGNPNDANIPNDATAQSYRDEKYSTYINLNNASGDAGVARGSADDAADMAEVEFIYGGAFEGNIMGSTHIYLGNGRIFNSFAGSCNADIEGHTETYVGRNMAGEAGFPWVRDHIYGGNDLGGRVKSSYDFTDRISTAVAHMVYNASCPVASAYIEYSQGRVEHIFGGCFGDYDYALALYSGRVAQKPYMESAFVNFKPNDNAKNSVTKVFGAGEGFSGDRDGDDTQDRSYVLVDFLAPGKGRFASTEVFGAGAYDGLGMRTVVNPASNPSNANDYQAALDNHSAVVDLMRGEIDAAYGGSYNEGITRRTVVNVPKKGSSVSGALTSSTISLNKIFGGAYGNATLLPCDVYESNVNYESGDAQVTSIYGGNNSKRRTVFTKVNVSATVWSDKNNGYQGTVFGAGCGKDTWAEYTEVNLKNGATVYRVYGGGESGKVYNAESVQAYMQEYKTNRPSDILTSDFTGEWSDAWKKAWSFGLYYPPNDNPDDNFTTYTSSPFTLSNPLVKTEEMDDRDTKTYKYNTNVLINPGATVTRYAYGGGKGIDAVIAGTTYIALLGGTVGQDLYAAGEGGPVEDIMKKKNFIASSNAYIKGGKVRNAYGGGWEGAVGHHTGDVDGSMAADTDGETHVVVGKKNATSFTDGLPSIERNVYGGGEGGAVWGTTYLTIYDGYIGYRHFDSAPSDQTLTTIVDQNGGYYQEKIHDETWQGDGTNRLYNSGCAFGGGYVDASIVDNTNVKMYGGHIRNAIFGGGEIAAIGRGKMHESGVLNSVRELQGIYKAGSTHVEMFSGHVHRNVFGGGRGYNNLGEGGLKYTDGYVFGQTEVHIHGGEIGTKEGVTDGYGNVFGGGDIGYVYSAYMQNGSLRVGKKSTEDGDGGYYYKCYGGSYVNGEYTGGQWDKVGTEKILTEDCKVLIEPYCEVTSGTVGSHSEGDYVPINELNALGNKTASADTWSKLDIFGIIIHNAVFAGGNTSSGSSSVYANTTTVFGNATATIHDVANRDLITIGTGHVGGLYGDGNLTFVDGYRELNITNYGTDYYSLDQQDIDKAHYDALLEREKAYYEIRYKCIQDCQDKIGNTYISGSTISQDQLLTLFAGTPSIDSNGEVNSAYWIQNGIFSRYAGRIMNTIQRADFCGVFGSRMVLQGAQDRVPEIVDFTQYTINRVGEVSLNQKYGHGNYFGIYNTVNFLGALTSDVDFHTGVRTSDNKDKTTYQASVTLNGNTYAYNTATYAQWKAAHANDRKRNNANSANQVALASGVYLELTTEKSTGKELNQKDWGLITGVVELDLINVQTGVGGGFVYAKNEHGKRTPTGKTQTTLTNLNQGAVSKAQFSYATVDDDKEVWQTSGNFVHSTQTIIDDCYNISGRYKTADGVPAHYWYIKGDVYVYDQYISAYTGTPNAYSETVDLPLTITAASHGTMKLLNVQPNLHAYYSSYASETNNVELEGEHTITINDVTYKRNDPISYWTWYTLSDKDKKLFVKETYVTIADCKIGDTPYPAGTVMLPSEYNSLKDSDPTVTYEENGVVKTDKDFDFFFRSSNNMSHDTGYILTYQVNNPTDWNKWYTEVADDHDGDGTVTKAREKNQTGGTGYEGGPTYHIKNNASGVYGQREYKESNIISKTVYDNYESMTKTGLTTTQAQFKPAYIVTKEYIAGDQHLYPGKTVSATAAASMTGYVAPAYICTNTMKLSDTEYIYLNTCMTEAEIDKYAERFPSLETTIRSSVIPAYYCTTEGFYGGNYYEAGHNYRGLEAWSAMSPADRSNFEFNYDAFDLLIDKDYLTPTTGGAYSEGKKYQYDGTSYTSEDDINDVNTGNPAGYSVKKPIDYQATYNGSETATYNGVTLANGTTYTRIQYEKLPNEQRHYTPIDVDAAGTYYVVNTPFVVGNTPYAVGQTIEASVYNGLSNKDLVTALTFSSDDANKKFYYCRESYTIGENGSGKSITTYNNQTYAVGATVPVGVVIAEGADGVEGTYKNLVNKQKNFTIHGVAPTEISTLYVARNSDIYDLSTEKIITVIYQYDYEETDESGLNLTPISERHVVNIHVEFKSGIPEIEDIQVPQIVLPGTKIGLYEPNVKPGAYEVTGGGWKLFRNLDDAESHTNGIPYTPNRDLLYWYQNGYYVAYFAKTYLGETYSNHVPVSVANYHDLTKVLADTDHHYYVDEPEVQRRNLSDSKIYITNPEDGATELKSLFDLSLLDENTVNLDEDGLITTDKTTNADSPFKGHALLESHVKGGADLEFILHTNVNHTGTWTPIGDATHCFEGNLHGDGYSINGLDHSLFEKLCGSIYNLGVTGSFTEAGIVNTGEGYVENCWVKTSATSGFATGSAAVKAVFGNPTASSGYQVVNCYYPEAPLVQDPENPSGPLVPLANYYKAGPAKAMPEKAFYNGTVAYNLNGFYLYKRYNDHVTHSGTPTVYSYFTDEGGTLTRHDDGKYDSHPEYCSSGYAGKLKYVEERYADGDFRYADGKIPEKVEERMYTDNLGKTRFSPIWPDDYLFFGQMLTYDYTTKAHEDVPSHLYKNEGRLVQSEQSNRVYRAPAYYQSKVMDVAHFNPWCNLVAYSKGQNENDPNVKEAYPNMTAIDFAGHGDTHSEASGTHEANAASGIYKLGLQGGKFYAPLLDDDGLESINNRDETPNLLAYAPSEAGNLKTYTVLNDYFTEPDYDDYKDKTEPSASAEHTEYKRVAAVESSKLMGIHGHLVQSDLTADGDHLLIDKKDFNCPISYQFVTGERMWYQRRPDRYVDMTKGWDDVSLPFVADLVTTNQKGEITHFYGGSANSHNTNPAKINHEYWLREYQDISKSLTNTLSEDEIEALFRYPAAINNDEADKTVTNTFLWDYYYSADNASGHHEKDANDDTYQLTYYDTSRTLKGYPRLANGKPYIIGFPGKTYYEFDLSGQFEAKTTAATKPVKLGQQTITFAAAPSAAGDALTIGVSDDELASGEVAHNGYTFTPNYMSKKIEGYMMNTNGNRYIATATGGTAAVPFRPYFTVTSGNSGARVVRSILFINDDEESESQNSEKKRKESVDGTLTITAGRHKIVVTSTLPYTEDVRIVSTNGIVVRSFTIKPGETIETSIYNAGVYIVQPSEIRFTKKLSVK